MVDGVSIDTFGANFIHYLPGVTKTLNLFSLARLLPKGSIKWEGKNLEWTTHLKRNPAIGAVADGGALPAAGKQGYEMAKAFRKNIVGSIKLTDNILNNAATTQHAAISVLDSEMRGLMESIRKFENYYFTRDGTGVTTLLGSVVDGSTITVDDGRGMWDGANFQILDTDGSTVHANFEVSKISRAFTAANEVTVTPVSAIAAGSQADGDYIVWKGSAGVPVSSYNLMPVGLDKLIDDASGTFQNISTSTYPRYTSPVLSNSGLKRPLTPSLFRQMLLAIKQESGLDAEVTVLGSHGQGIAMEEMYEGDLRINETTTVGGVKIARFQSFLGTVNVVTDPDSPYGVLFFADMSQISRAVQKELDWRRPPKSEGGIFVMSTANLSYTATCLETLEYIIFQRNRCGKIKDLDEQFVTAFG